jgi:hypothetical protein
MSVTLANEIRPAGLPMYCSACGCQDGEKRHVDFDAGCDRGYGAEGAVKVAMEDLILCETCLRSGAALVGMVDGDEPGQRIAQLEQQLAAEKLRADKAVAYADRMEGALQARPEPLKVRRPRGRPPKATRQKEAATA